MNDIVAERRLRCVGKADGVEREVRIGICRPEEVDGEDVDLPGVGRVVVCRTVIDGIEEFVRPCVGADTLQAVRLASDIDALVKRLSRRYDFYFLDGEPYFDESL